MEFLQREIVLRPRPRGCHLISGDILDGLPDLRGISHGLLHLHILHTSASLTVNENADPDVRHDLTAHLERMVPEGLPHYRHTLEGADDMPAHIKGTLTGFDLTLPIRDGALWLGTWQGVYLCEHRDRGGSRRIAATIMGVRSSQTSGS